MAEATRRQRQRRELSVCRMHTHHVLQSSLALSQHYRSNAHDTLYVICCIFQLCRKNHASLKHNGSCT